MQLKMFPFSGSSLYILGYCMQNWGKWIQSVFAIRPTKRGSASMKFTADLVRWSFTGWVHLLHNMNEKERTRDYFTTQFKHRYFYSHERGTSCGLCQLLWPDVKPSLYWQHQSAPHIHTLWREQPSWQTWERKKKKKKQKTAELLYVSPNQKCIYVLFYHISFWSQLIKKLLFFK